MSKCDSSSEKVLKLLTHPGSEHSNISISESDETELSVVVSLHLYTRVSLQSKNYSLTTRPVFSWLSDTSSSKGTSLPRPTPYDLQTRITFSSNWMLCSLLNPSILFTSKFFLVSSTTQTHALVPFTGLSESALLMSAAVRMSCPSLQYRRMHVFIGHKIRSHTSLLYCGSE